MTLYQAIQYFKYKWKAKGRHGTHSPFVYSFVENVLMRSADEGVLMKNIPSYFNIKKAVELTVSQDGKVNALPILSDKNNGFQTSCPMDFNELYLVHSNPAVNHLIFDTYLPKTGKEDILILKPLYKNEQYKLQWEGVKKDRKVTLSIDLFGMGLLFFREDFKEQQHFVLKK